uniref:Putative secreted protein n=1 Tax=Anopheles darlingi TaxID=43151 RepID=A0A2M4DMG2_ANODA
MCYPAVRLVCRVSTVRFLGGISAQKTTGTISRTHTHTHTARHEMTNVQTTCDARGLSWGLRTFVDALDG